MIEKGSLDIFTCDTPKGKLVACAKETGFDTVDVFVFIVSGEKRQYWFVEMPESEYEEHCMSKDADGVDCFPKYALNSPYMNHVGYNEIGFASDRKMVESALADDFEEAAFEAIEAFLVQD